MFSYIFFSFVSEEEVDGESFVALTEETLRSNFPKLNFGQRKACSKLISIILSSIDKYIFKDNETNANQIKNMSPEELSIFLQDECSSILPATVVLLLSKYLLANEFIYTHVVSTLHTNINSFQMKE